MKVIQILTDVKTKIKYMWFHCPGCDMKHQIPVSAQGSSDPLTWKWNGSEEAPTCSPSMRCQHSIVCHYFIKNGHIGYCSDSQHEYAGKSYKMPEFKDW